MGWTERDGDALETLDVCVCVQCWSAWSREELRHAEVVPRQSRAREGVRTGWNIWWATDVVKARGC